MIEVFGYSSVPVIFWACVLVLAFTCSAADTHADWPGENKFLTGCLLLSYLDGMMILFEVHSSDLTIDISLCIMLTSARVLMLSSPKVHCYRETDSETESVAIRPSKTCAYA